MSKEALISKYEALPAGAQRQAEAFIEFLSATHRPRRARPAKRRFKFDWAGGLEDLRSQFTAVELQHRLNDWR